MTSRQHIVLGLSVAFVVSVTWYTLLLLADELGLDAVGIAGASVYFVTVLWIFMASGALLECVMELTADLKELKRARHLSLIILIRTAFFNTEHAILAVAQGVMKLLVGLVAGYLLYKIGPSPDYSPTQLLLRFFFMLDIYWFWMAKRKTRARRRNMPTADLSKVGELEGEDGALQTEHAREEVTAEIRENRRIFAEFGAVVLEEIREIKMMLGRKS